MRKNKKKALITDIDNTLFDWFTMWHESFKAMIDKVSEISEIPVNELYPDIKRIHQKYGTAEYAFLLEEIDVLKLKYGNSGAMRAALSDAISIYREERKRHMLLYPGVGETLFRLKNLGITIIAFSESKKYYSSFRIEQLGLDGVISVVYCPEDHVLPSDRENTDLLQYTECRTLHGEFKKPNPGILLEILSDLSLHPNDVLYVGDSKSKDIAMAIGAGIDYLWFEAGSAHLSARAEEYELLKKVTHWSDAEVLAEKEYAANVRSLGVPSSRTIQEYSEVVKFFYEEYEEF